MTKPEIIERVARDYYNSLDIGNNWAELRDGRQKNYLVMVETILEAAGHFGVMDKVEQLIRETEECPLYGGQERFWLLSAYRNVRRLVSCAGTATTS
jgi:hypothetical protein